MASKQITHGKGFHYDKSILLNRQIDAYEFEVLLLAWVLLLYRQSSGNYFEFSWGLCETGSFACQSFKLTSSNLPLIATDTISTVLENLKRYRREQLQLSEDDKRRHFTLLVNDECAASGPGFCCNDSDGFSVDWVSQA